MNIIDIVWPWGAIFQARDALQAERAEHIITVHALGRATKARDELAAANARQAETIRSLHAAKDKLAIVTAENERLKCRLAPFEHVGDA